ncbi:hypothetical protein N9C39_10795 [Luminiphilus sp.]|nr:hypothetical protein [Luminiphilus sp.]
MITVTNVLIAIALILLFAYFKMSSIHRKLTELLEATQREEERYFESEDGNHAFQDRMQRLVRVAVQQSKHLEQISCALNADNPAGDQSAKARRKRNLTALYAQHLSEHEGLPHDHAEARAAFEFDCFEEEPLVERLDEDSLYTYEARHNKSDRIKKAFFATGQLESEIVGEHPVPADTYGAVWRLFEEDGFLSTEDEIAVMDSHPDSYWRFVFGRRILMALVDLGIAEILETDREGYRLDEPEFKFTTTDLEEIKSKVYGEGNSRHEDDFFQERYDEDKLPKFFVKQLIT